MQSQLNEPKTMSNPNDFYLFLHMFMHCHVKIMIISGSCDNLLIGCDFGEFKLKI